MFRLLKSIIIYAIALAGVSCENSHVSSSLFTRLSSKQTGITFINTNTENENHNILSYEYFYNGGGVAVGDINNDGLADIYFTSNQGDNKLYLNKGNFKFEDITEKAGLSANSGWRTGASMVDINADGYLDIYVCRSGNQHPSFRTNSLFINNKNLTFTDKAYEYGLDDDSYSTHAAFFDYDEDGDLDVFLLNHSRLHISNSYDISKRYKNQRVRYVGNKLFRNDNGKFTDVSDSLGIHGPASNYGLGVAYSDINNDGWLDLYLSNDYTEKDKLLLNINGKFFEEVSDSLLTHISQFSMGVEIADVNNDGFEDIITLDMLPENNKRQKEFHWPEKYDVYRAMVKNGLHHQYMRNMLHLNNGNGTFSEIGQLAGVSNTDWSWAPLLADFDNDGWQDLFISNGFKRNFTSNDFLKYKSDLAIKARQGKNIDALNEVLESMPSTKAHNYIYKNLNGINFLNMSEEWGFQNENLTNGVAYADLDNDGDLDLILNNLDEEAGIYRNNADKNDNGYLKIKLKGSDKNTFGLGSKVTVFYKGKIKTRTLCPYGGFQSSTEPSIHFGVGQIEKLDSVIVEWPCGEVEKLRSVKPNQSIVLFQKNAVKAPKYLPVINTFFKARKGLTDYKHHENDFIDFKIQSLLPRMYSTQGPAIAGADVNGDGLMDIYLGGAKGQQGIILMQNDKGEFKKTNSLAFPSDLQSEDVDAIFFDMDSDGDQDLYVVSGGYEFNISDKSLQDRLYQNDGKGNFKKVYLPEFYSSGSCVRPTDLDGDNDLDLFIGGRIIPGKYPETPESYILLNNGKGIFSIETNKVAPGLRNIGMVTDAEWVDINHDNFRDLLIVGEWMSVKVFINQKGRLVDKSADFFKEKTIGWWNSILADDFDKDRDMDLIVGNFGMNNQFKASAIRPVTLYYADYDNNGSVDPIMNYFIGDKSYPMPTLDELKGQSPIFKKRFINYESYTTANIDDILNSEELEKSEFLAANTFKTTYFQNEDGKFTSRPLPVQVQYAPVMAIEVMDVNNDGNKDIVMAGNISGMRARFGKATGNFGTLLLGDDKGKFKYIPPVKSGLCIRGDVRGIVKDGKKLIFSVNDGFPEIYALD